MSDKPNIEPFFDLIIKAVKKLVSALIKFVLSPVISVLKKIAKILVDFIADNILKPIFKPIGDALSFIVAPLKPLFAFIAKILDFLVSILKFLANIVDMLLSLPFRILGGMGLITYPAAPDPRFTNLGDLNAINKLSNTMSDVNSNLTDSANGVNRVVNQPNMIIFLTIIILAILFISLYYIYDQFGSIIDTSISTFKNFFYPDVAAE